MFASIIPIILGIIGAATAVGGSVASGNASKQAEANAAKERAWKERQQAAEIDLRKKQMAQQQQQAGMDMMQGVTSQNIQQNQLASADQQDVSNKTASDLAKAFLRGR